MSKDAKNVPALRFKGYSNAWEKRKLLGLTEKIIDFRGRTPRKLNMHWSDSGYLALSALNVKMGYIDQNADAHFGNEILYQKWMGNSELQTGDVILTTEAPLGNVFLVGAETKFILSQRTIALRTNKSQLNPQFLAVLLSSPIMQTNLRKLSTGGTALGISQKNLKFLVINLPTNILEQQAIGSTLMELDSLIAATQRRINALEEIKEASSQYLFVQEWNFRGYSSPWKQVKLGEIADIIGGGTPKTDEPKFWNGEIDWYAPAEIGSNRYVSGSVRTITSVGLNKSSASILPANRTILFTSRAGIGNAAILKKDAATNQGFQSLVLKDGVDVYFMYSKIPEIKQKAIRIAAGSTFLEISGKKLSQIALLVPELNEQQRIGAFFKKLDDLIAANHSKVSRLNLLKRFLLQGLFI